MSHYKVLVLTDKEIDEDTLYDLLAPYDENLEVPEYVSKTKKELAEYYKDFLQSWYEECLKNDDSKIKVQANEIKKKLDSFTDDDSIIKMYKEDYPDDRFDEDDNLLSTYNPNSKYDWYDIGGRFSDSFRLKDGSTADQAYAKDIDFEIDSKEYREHLRWWELAIEEQESKDGEEAPFVFYRKEYYLERYKDKETYANIMSRPTFYAVVTKDGWYSKGDMGWFCASSETAEESLDWDLNFFERYIQPAIDNNDYLTVVDCHI